MELLKHIQATVNQILWKINQIACIKTFRYSKTRSRREWCQSLDMFILGAMSIYVVILPVWFLMPTFLHCCTLETCPKLIGSWPFCKTYFVLGRIWMDHLIVQEILIHILLSNKTKEVSVTQVLLLSHRVLIVVYCSPIDCVCRVIWGG
jgi:hypothetical protein